MNAPKGSDSPDIRSRSPDVIDVERLRADDQLGRRRRLPGWLATIGVVVFIAFAAVGTRNLSGGDGATDSNTRGSSQGAVGVKKELSTRLLASASERLLAPDFSVETTVDKTFSLSSARGRIVVLSFLSPGCESCEEEVDALKAVHQRLGSRGVDVLLLDLGGLGDEEILDYYRNYLEGGDHLYAADVDYAVGGAYEVVSLGTTVVIDRQARIAYRDEGLTPVADLLAVVNEALGEG